MILCYINFQYLSTCTYMILTQESLDNAKVSARPQCVYEGTWQYGSIFIRLAVVTSQICKIPRNFPKIRTYNSSRSSKVIDLDANRKLICNSLLVINGLILDVSPRFTHLQNFTMLLAICKKKLAIFAATGNYFRPWWQTDRQTDGR